jgi:hypothetical protein
LRIEIEKVVGRGRRLTMGFVGGGVGGGRGGGGGGGGGGRRPDLVKSISVAFIGERLRINAEFFGR